MSKKFTEKEVNTQTGEIRNKSPLWMPYLDTGSYIKEDMIEGFKERKEFEDRFFNFITEFQTNLREKYNANFAEIGKLLVLMTYTSYRNSDTGKHYILTDNNWKMDNKNLSKIWKLSGTQTRNTKSDLKKKGLLFEDEEGLYINDDIMIRGKLYPTEKRNLNYYVVFDKSIRNLYNSTTEQGVRDSSKSMGLLLSLIPFIRVSTSKKKQGKKGSNNALVMSEWDENTQEYKPINKHKLTKILGVSNKTLDNYLGNLNNKSKEITGRYFLYEIKPSGINNLDKTILIINPYYTYTQGTGSESFRIIEGWIQEAEDGNNLE